MFFLEKQNNMLLIAKTRYSAQDKESQIWMFGKGKKRLRYKSKSCEGEIVDSKYRIKNQPVRFLN